MRGSYVSGTVRAAFVPFVLTVLLFTPPHSTQPRRSGQRGGVRHRCARGACAGCVQLGVGYTEECRTGDFIR